MTSVHMERAYNVTLVIDSVRPQDAGTVTATDNNGVVGADKNVVELIVIGKIDCKCIIIIIVISFLRSAECEISSSRPKQLHR